MKIFSYPTALFACFTAVILASPFSTMAEPAVHERIPLWPDTAPLGEGKFGKSEAAITIHLPKPELATGKVVVICPGGGYGGLVTGPEGHGIADWLAAHGTAGVVLEYRLPKGNRHLPLLDAQRAIRLVRSKAAQKKWSPTGVGICGFSAGGHLAATAATHFDVGNPKATEEAEKQSCRPDFAILVYPVISMGEKGHAGSRNNLLGPNPTPAQLTDYSNELQVTAKTPPCFLAHAKDDKVVSLEHSQLFATALEKAGVKHQLLVLAHGGHGLSGYKGPSWDEWQTAAIAWIGQQ